MFVNPMHLPCGLTINIRHFCEPWLNGNRCMRIWRFSFAHGKCCISSQSFSRAPAFCQSAICHRRISIFTLLFSFTIVWSIQSCLITLMSISVRFFSRHCRPLHRIYLRLDYQGCCSPRSRALAHQCLPHPSSPFAVYSLFACIQSDIFSHLDFKRVNSEYHRMSLSLKHHAALFRSTISWLFFIVVTIILWRWQTTSTSSMLGTLPHWQQNEMAGKSCRRSVTG